MFADLVVTGKAVTPDMATTMHGGSSTTTNGLDRLGDMGHLPTPQFDESLDEVFLQHGSQAGADTDQEMHCQDMITA